MILVLFSLLYFLTQAIIISSVGLNFSVCFSTKEDTDGINHIYNTLTNTKVEVIETTFKTSINTSITLNLDNIDKFYNWFCVNRNKFFITYEEFKNTRS